MKESSDQSLQCCIYKLTGHGKLTNRSMGLNALYILANIFFPNELNGALSKKKWRGKASQHHTSNIKSPISRPRPVKHSET
jgi:hypothetical protein